MKTLPLKVEDGVSVLSKTEFFGGMERARLVELVRRAACLQVEKRETLFIEGDSGDTMYFLLEGAVQLSKDSATGQEVVIRTVKPGEIFGEVILFESSRYPVTAAALTGCKLIGFGRKQITELLRHENFRDDFIKMLMKKQRYLAERVRYLNAYDVEERLFRFFHEQFGTKTEFASDFSKRNLASSIGATPETLSRLLARLKKRGLIKVEGNSWQLPDKYWEDFSNE